MINQEFLLHIRLLLVSMLIFGLVDIPASDAKTAAKMNVEQILSYRFNHYIKRHGLGNVNVLQVLQDRQGYIWAATQSGLYRFDGYDFKGFKHQSDDHRSLANSYVKSLYEDSNGQLWVGTRGGVLHQYVAEQERFIRYPFDVDYPNTSVSTSDVMGITGDKNQQLWLATFGAGVQRFDIKSKRFTGSFGIKNGLSDNKVYGVLADSDGIVWIGTRDGGLNRLYPDTGEVRYFKHDSDNPNSLSHNRVYCLVEREDGSIWLGTRGGGVNRFDKKTERFYAYRHDSTVDDSLSSDHVWSIFEDKAGRLWVGTRDGGLNGFNDKKGSFARFISDDDDQYSLNHNRVMSISQDIDGRMWLGTFGGGLNNFDPSHSRFGYIRHLGGQGSGLSLSKSVVRAMTTDALGNLWIGTSRGLIRYNPNTDEHHLYQYDATSTADDSKHSSHQNVRAILSDNKGYIWVGTDPGGLSRLDTNTGLFTHYRHDPKDPNSLSDNRVLVLHQQPQGQLWVGTTNGLNRFDSKSNSFIRYQHDANYTSTLSDDGISALYTDEEDGLWVGTWGGLNRFNHEDESFERYRHHPGDASSLSHNEVNAIYQDRQGSFWIGTAGGGLNRFNAKTGQFKHYRIKQGLGGDIVRGIVADHQGYLWLGLADGISRFNSVNETFVNNIGLEAGCIGIAERSYFQAKDGKLYFGARSGYCAFYPEDVIQAATPAQAILTDFKLLNQSVPIDNSGILNQAINLTKIISLGYQDNILSFEFAALHFANPMANQFKYQLEGFSSKWLTTGADNRRATYTNLPSGTYTFRVKASNHQGVWGQSKEIQLNVQPAPWHTWWAYSVYALLIMAMLYYFYHSQQVKLRYQKQVNDQLKQVDKLKDNFLANTSHELRTPLNGIIGLTESLLDGVAGPLPTKAQQNLTMVACSGRRLANLVNDILDFSKLKSTDIKLAQQPVDLYSATQVVLTLLKPLADNKGVKLINDVAQDLIAAHADENRVQQILQNLVGNGIKFTDKGEVCVSARLLEQESGMQSQQQMVVISVSDSGIGIDRKEFDSIFNSFEQVERSMTRSQGGTGLGLSVSKQLVELHGGVLSVDSCVGIGSSFSFTLPVSKQSASPLADLTAHARTPMQNVSENIEQIDTAPHLTCDGEHFRILLVDDEPINRQVLLNHLAFQRYELVEASSGEQALQIIEKGQPFDLVILDIMMPKVSGYEVCRRLRKHYPASDLPVIFLTAKNQLVDLVKSFNAGGNDYLNKPVNKPELLARVESHLKLLDVHRHLEHKVCERTESLRQANEQLRTLSNIGLQLNQSLDLHQVLRAIFDSVAALMDVGRFGIGLYQPDSERLEVEFIFEDEKSYRPFNRDMADDSQFAVWCIKNRKTIFINELATEGENYIKNHEYIRGHLRFTLDDASRCEMRPPESMMYVPLLLQQQVVGFLTVQSFESHAYEQKDLDILTTLAHYMATAIDNAKMHQVLVENETQLAKQQSKQQLVEADKMAALGSLSVGIAHEINNPTNFVGVGAHNLEHGLNDLQAFLLQLAADADDEVKDMISEQFTPLRQHLETITLGTERIVAIVQDLRTFTHTNQSGAVEANIYQNLRATISLVRAQYKEKINFVLEECDLPKITCILGEINQVFMNLIINGVDAIGEKQQGIEDDKLGEIRISGKAYDGHIEISVSDSGNGMNEQTKERLFDPFYTTKPLGKGTGLGLSISFGIVQKHGGEIRVESTLGKGTTFTVVLPR